MLYVFFKLIFFLFFTMHCVLYYASDFHFALRDNVYIALNICVVLDDVPFRCIQIVSKVALDARYLAWLTT